jgi:predicted dithiol-disulfide oxidoreductase (DUF899 family)
MHGLSVLYKNSSGYVFHSHSSYARGIDMRDTAYQYLDLLPKGGDGAALSPKRRDETDQRPTMAWLRMHDEYEADWDTLTTILRCNRRARE